MKQSGGRHFLCGYGNAGNHGNKKNQALHSGSVLAGYCGANGCRNSWGRCVGDCVDGAVSICRRRCAVSALGAAGGVAVDSLVGEPPLAWHPVAKFGSAMVAIERSTYRNSRAAGVVHLTIGAGAALAVGLGARRLLGPALATASATALASAGRMLDREALGVAAHLAAGDLGAAREALCALAGRTPDDLDESELARAVIESVAENSVDAVVSSILWGVVGGAPAVLVHRATNTLDAMVGHHNDRYEQFGWASARLDDLLNFLPARLAASAVAACRPRAAKQIVETIRCDAHQHPSPNGGVIEAAYAAALGVQLGGINRYGDGVEDRGTLGVGRAPAVADIRAAVRLRRQTTMLLAGATGLMGAVRLAQRR